MKICVQCGRTIEPRKRWTKNWDEIKYCSDQCRKNKSSAKLDDYILEFLSHLPKTKSTDFFDLIPEKFKSDSKYIENLKQAARRLVHINKIHFIQNGRIADSSTVKGHFQLKLADLKNK